MAMNQIAKGIATALFALLGLYAIGLSFSNVYVLLATIFAGAIFYVFIIWTINKVWPDKTKAKGGVLSSAMMGLIILAIIFIIAIIYLLTRPVYG
jgi:hypothetical protein